MVRSLKFIVRAIVFDGLEGCMCERKRYQKNIKSETKIRPKIDEQSIQIRDRKRDTQNMEINQQIDPKIMRKRRNNLKHK